MTDRDIDEVCPYVVGETTRYCSLTTFTLTDEERRAIEAGIANCEDITYGGPNDEEAAAVLRRLLERLG
jgi:hypothetical protein